MSTQKAQKRRQDRNRQRKHQQKLARSGYAAALPRPFEVSPDGRALCPHYQDRGSVVDGWTVIRSAGGGYRLAVCPGCMTYLFGPGLADLLHELGPAAAGLLRKVA